MPIAYLKRIKTIKGIITLDFFWEIWYNVVKIRLKGDMK